MANYFPLSILYLTNGRSSCLIWVDESPFAQRKKYLQYFFHVIEVFNWFQYLLCCFYLFSIKWIYKSKLEEIVGYILQWIILAKGFDAKMFCLKGPVWGSLNLFNSFSKALVKLVSVRKWHNVVAIITFVYSTSVVKEKNKGRILGWSEQR